MEVMFIDLRDFYHYKDVDLADLVTLIDWSKPVSVDQMKEIGMLVTSGEIDSKIEWDSLSLQEKNALCESYSNFKTRSSGLRSVNFFCFSHLRRPPIKKDENVIGGVYAKPAGNRTDKVSWFPAWFNRNYDLTKFVELRPLPVYFLKTHERSGLVKCFNTEVFGIESGTYLDGKKVK